MPSVLITAFASRSDATTLADEVLTELDAMGIDAEFHVLDGVPPTGLTPDSLIVSLGGDGTFLRSARLAHDADCRVLGVELGRVGFLLDVPPADITQQVKLALASPQFEGRLALAITLPGASDAGFALNEVLVGSSEPGRMVRVRTFVDSDPYLTYNADGVMVATPTGSTGHNFSAGGPVVDAGIPVMLLTPVAPHFTIDRTIVVSDARVIRLEAVERGAMVFADGHSIGSLDAGESVTISKSSRPVKVVATRQSELVNRLRKGLREGHA